MESSRYPWNLNTNFPYNQTFNALIYANQCQFKSIVMPFIQSVKNMCQHSRILASWDPYRDFLTSFKYFAFLNSTMYILNPLMNFYKKYCYFLKPTTKACRAQYRSCFCAFNHGVRTTFLALHCYQKWKSRYAWNSAMYDKIWA